MGEAADVSNATLAKALTKDGVNHAGLIRAIANVLRGEDETYQIEIVRRRAVNPGGFLRAESPLDVLQFVEIQLEKGIPRKAAIEDACHEFSISRATVYQRIKLARQQKRNAAKAQASPTRPPGGRHIERSKRAIRRKKRKHTPKKKRLGVVIHPGIMQKLARSFRRSKESADRLDD